ncbi:hypothetical protein CBR_g52251 [Chara braunii]|uniref:Ammonium transporter AmtB-like domain-containing protein n=1 Tax=Chara braunii TaxID=69332 RepID=A0A388M9W6_CHABU|nr:hypothetical protein CBR_g52251 [Chara braunii]|eukprot:GBG91364.1 hypothetical protein CBR_g52251 [Chara braunii]
MGFWAIGYALAFGEGNAMFGWRQEDGVPALFNSENEVLFFFQYTFCATATTIAGGAVAERTQFSAYALYSIVISTIIYPVVVHLAWSRSGLLSPWRGANILGTNGFMDNAGSGVVHITGGVTALISCWIVGPRVGRFNLEGLVVPFRSHSLVFTAGGTLFLWLGFFSFNGGSVMFQPAVGLHHWYVTIGHVCMNTCLSAAGAGVATYLLVQTSDISTPFDLLNSLITGAVASCAPASLILPWAAAFVGFCSGAMYLLFARLLMWMRIDDVVNASAVHIAGGMAGIVGVGLFATREGITNTYGIKEPLAIGLCYSGSGRLLLVQVQVSGCDFAGRLQGTLWLMVVKFDYPSALSMLYERPQKE